MKQGVRIIYVRMAGRKKMGRRQRCHCIKDSNCDTPGWAWLRCAAAVVNHITQCLIMLHAVPLLTYMHFLCAGW